VRGRAPSAGQHCPCPGDCFCGTRYRPALGPAVRHDPAQLPHGPPPCSFHWPSIYYGNAGPGGAIVQPVYWFVDLLAPFHVSLGAAGAQQHRLPICRNVC
jgi:hypothetical protein